MVRFLHVMLRVANLDDSIQFYESCFDMKCLRKKEYPNGKFTLAFLGFNNESTETVIELTYNWGQTSYELGSAFGHLAFGVKNVQEACDKIKSLGGKVVRQPGPMKFGGGTVLAFVEDPDGYKIELLERV